MSNLCLHCGQAVSQPVYYKETMKVRLDEIPKDWYSAQQLSAGMFEVVVLRQLERVAA